MQPSFVNLVSQLRSHIMLGVVRHCSVAFHHFIQNALPFVGRLIETHIIIVRQVFMLMMTLDASTAAVSLPVWGKTPVASCCDFPVDT